MYILFIAEICKRSKFFPNYLEARFYNLDSLKLGCSKVLLRKFQKNSCDCQKDTLRFAKKLQIKQLYKSFIFYPSHASKLWVAIKKNHIHCATANISLLLKDKMIIFLYLLNIIFIVTPKNKNSVILIQQVLRIQLWIQGYFNHLLKLNMITFLFQSKQIMIISFFQW